MDAIRKMKKGAQKAGHNRVFLKGDLGPILARFRQLALSAPHLARLLGRSRSPRDIYNALYFKIPYLFTLKPFPPVVSIEVTGDCNLSCIHCGRRLREDGGGPMDIGLFKKIIDEIIRHPRTQVVLCGLGEPLLHPDFEEMMDGIAACKVDTLLNTNGTLLDRFPPERYVTWGLKDLYVSVDGLDARSFETIRRGACFDSVRENVRAIHDFRSAGRHEFPRISICHVIFPGEKVLDLIAFKSGWSKISDSVKFHYYIPLKGDSGEKRPFLRRRCRNLKRYFFIRWNGGVPLCGYQYRYGECEWLGNVGDSSIGDLWKHPRLEEVREAHRRRDFDSLPFCVECVKTRLG